MSICISLTPLQSAHAKVEHIKAILECPNTGVPGFPILVTLTISNTSKDIPHSMLRMDAATKTDGWYAKGITIEFITDAGTITTVGTSRTGRPDVRFGNRPPSLWIMSGEQVTTTFDINQLILQWGLGETPRVAEKYKIRLLCHNNNAVSEYRDIVIRDPTVTEQQYLASLAKQGIKDQWFPTIITRNDLELPPSGGLPGDTALLCDYISALRLALRNPAAAIEAFGARTDWGFYADAIKELEYECACAVHGKESKLATAKRAELQATGLTGRLTRIDKDGGLLTRFGILKKTQ